VKTKHWLYVAISVAGLVAASTWWFSSRVTEPLSQYDPVARAMISKLMPAVGQGDADPILDQFSPMRVPQDRTKPRERMARWKDLGGLKAFDEPSLVDFEYVSGEGYPYQATYDVVSHFVAADVVTQWVLVSSGDGAMHVWDVAVGQAAERAH
jgi:hypothetical protein